MREQKGYVFHKGKSWLHEARWRVPDFRITSDEQADLRGFLHGKPGPC